MISVLQSNPPPPKIYKFKQMNIHFNVMLPEFTSNIKMTEFKTMFYILFIIKLNWTVF